MVNWTVNPAFPDNVLVDAIILYISAGDVYPSEYTDDYDDDISSPCC